MPTYYDDFADTDSPDARSLKKRFDGLSNAIAGVSAAVPSGALTPHAGSSVPTGWLLCDGSAVSRSTYAALFAIIGTTFGVGDNVTTFNLPDIRGRAAVGAGTGSGLTARTLAQQLGEENHQLTTPELAAHTHPIQTTTAGTITSTAGAANIVANTGITGSAGSGTPHNTMQPSVVLNWIIKT